MSYLNYKTNPERIHVYRSRVNPKKVKIHTSKVFLGNKRTKASFPEVKYKSFMSLLSKWDKEGWIKRKSKVGKLSVIEMSHNGDLFIKLSFGRYSTLFSIVTWEYLVINVLRPNR